jgi:hypothetical protein
MVYGVSVDNTLSPLANILARIHNFTSNLSQPEKAYVPGSDASSSCHDIHCFLENRNSARVAEVAYAKQLGIIKRHNFFPPSTVDCLVQLPYLISRRYSKCF